MRKRSYRDYSTIRIPCEFLNGTVKAHFVKIQDKEVFLSRKLTTRLDDAICMPLWLAKKEGLV